MTLIKSLTVAGVLCLSAAAQAAGMGLMVENPWIRVAPPTAAAQAGYMVVHNGTERERALVAASSPAFANVMLHRTVMEDGLAKMVHQMKITVPAGGRVVFEPNGYHLMLMQPKQPLQAGDKVPVTLEFADGETLELTFEVRAGGNMGHMEHGHGAMHH